MITVHNLRDVETETVRQWLDHIAANMRQEDKNEAQAMSGLSPLDALVTSFNVSTHAYVITGRDDKPCTIFGAAPHPLPGVGVVWMLGTDDMKTEAFQIARQTSQYLEEVQAAYPLIWNYIDPRNELSMRWLRWGGFKLLGDKPMGPAGLPFHIFARTKSCV